MLNLDYTKISHGNCYDGMLYLLLDGKGFSADLLYLSSFTFLSEVIEPEDWKESNVYRNERPEQMAFKIFGLVTRRLSCPLENMHDIIRSATTTHPVGIWVDPFYCAWTPSFKEYHFSHFVLIIGLDELNRKYRCVDIYFPQIGFFDLSFEEATNLCKYLDIFSYVGEQIKDEKGLLNILKNHLPSIRDVDSSRRKALDYFLDLDLNRIKEVALIPDKEVDSSTISTRDQIEVSRFLTMFGYLSDCKRTFIKAIKVISIFFPNFQFDELYLLLNQNAIKYSLLRGMIIKYSIAGKRDTVKIEKKIDDIYEIDKRILEILMRLLDSKDC